MTTGFLFHEKYLWHATGTQWLPTEGEPYTQPLAHVESPETKRRFKNLVDASALADVLIPLKPRIATVDEVKRVHDPAYVQRIAEQSARDGGEAGFGTPFARGSYEIALLSAGGVITAVEAVMTGQVRNAYALARPPGHHALPHTGYGFCIFNNLAIAIRHVQQTYGLKRIALLDWDVHHGNGAQAIFYREPGVLTMSIHQDRCYPKDSGLLNENGEGEGAGYNLNVPLPPGSGHGAYLATFERVILPALRRYRPELLLIANGLDANYFDPLSRMMAYSETFRFMTRSVVQIAEALCGGRIVIAHEGGYSDAYVPFCGLAVMEALSGAPSGITDPFLDVCASAGGQELQPWQAAVIGEAERLVERIT